MELKIIRETSTELTVSIRKSSLEIVNRLRRILLTDMTTPYFKWIEIIENKTSIHGEILANRLMMIPINRRSKYQFDGNDDDPIIFFLTKSLSIDAPQPYIITSDDISPGNKKAENYEIESNITMTLLQPGESIKIKIHLDHVLENMENTSINSPISTCSYRKGKKNWIFTMECPSVYNCKELIERGVKKLDVDHHFIQ